MRILISGVTGESIPPPYAGIPKHTMLLARSWRELGHEVAATFVYRHDKEDDMGAQGTYFFEYKNAPKKLTKLFFLIRYACWNPALYAQLLIQTVRAHKKINPEIALSAAYGVFIDGVCRSFRPNIILAETALLKTFVLTYVAKRRGIPIVIHTYAEVHDMTMSVNKYLRDRKLWQYWSEFLGRANKIISPSHYCALGPQKYVPKEKVDVVYYGIDTGPYEHLHATQIEAREHFSIPQKVFAVMAVGALTSRKGHDHLIQVAGILAREGKPIEVILCGPGDSAWLEDIARREGIEAHVHFFSKLSENELALLYRCADLYCDASNTPRACLGMSLTESMLTELPVVAYAMGGMPEVVHEGKNGTLVSPNDISGLARAIERVRAMAPDERRAWGEAGKALAKREVDLETQSKRTLTILEAVHCSHPAV
ncbi:MAG TPA: glycosyltransferase family 4 protein [Candidatus Paceibacterota bacterium]|nr:glycosyltransferase family 4 protein [Candidatus Paceibacterota bacterium]